MNISTYLPFCCFTLLLNFVVSQYSSEPLSEILLDNVCMPSGYCYDIWQFGTPVTRKRAKQKCLEAGQTLATIVTREDELALATRLASDAWIGLSIAVKNRFYWLGETGWYENPIPAADILTDGNYGSGCLILNRQELRDGSCNYIFPYICEFREEPAASVGCDNSTLQLNNRWICMKINSERRWVEAARDCNSFNGNLLMILNAEELEKVQKMMGSKPGHYWTAGTHIITEWDEGEAGQGMLNPYSLLWSDEVQANPNVEEAFTKDVCVYLSEEKNSLIHKLCEDRLNMAICSQRDDRVTTAAEVTRRSSVGTRGDEQAECPDMVVSKERYKMVMIFAYVLAGLLIIAIALFIALFIWRRQRKRRKANLYDATYSRKASYKTLGNGTLGRQRSTDPIEEWDKVLSENNDSQMVERLSEADLDIIHNVPEEVLTIPRESEVVTLQRGKSMESHSSLANSDVATFTIDRASSKSSILKPPPVPPKTPCSTAGHRLGLPPPPPDLVPDSTPMPPQFPPPIHDDLADFSPPLQPKALKRPPRKQKKKPSDAPIYSEINKPRKLPPPPTSPKPNLPILTKGLLHTLPPPPPPLNIDMEVPADNFSDSGVDMGVNSPPYSMQNGDPKLDLGSGLH